MILFQFIARFTVILIYLFALFQQHWALSLAVFLWLINFLFSMGAMGSPEIAGLGAKWAQMCAQNSGRRAEILRNIFVIKTFSSPEREMNFVSEDTDAETKVKCQIEVRMCLIWAWIWCTYWPIQCGAIGLYWFYDLPIGGLVATMVSLQTLAFSLIFFTFAVSNLVRNISEIQNGLTLFDSELDPNLAQIEQVVSIESGETKASGKLEKDLEK